METHLLAIFVEVGQLRSRADGEVGHASRAPSPHGGGEEAQTQGRDGVADGGVEQNDAALRAVEIPRREKNEEDERTGGRADHHREREFRGELERTERAARLVSSDEGHRAEDAEEECPHLQKICGRHRESLIDAHGPADEIGHSDKADVRTKETEAGEPGLFGDIAQDAERTASRFRVGDLHGGICSSFRRRNVCCWQVADHAMP